jgi:hypothetical protein
MRFALQIQAYQLRAYTDFKGKIGREDPSVAGHGLDDFLPWYYTHYFDGPSGAPKDATDFPEFDTGPVLGVGKEGRAAGGPNEPAPEFPTSGSRKALKDIFGG